MLKNIITGLALGFGGYMIWRYLNNSDTVTTPDGEGTGWLDGITGDFLQMSNTVMPASGMRISLNGLAKIKQEEGLKLVRYDDATGQPLARGQKAKGYPTIGYGHKLGTFEDLWTITEAEATRLLVSDLVDAESAVNRLVKVPLTQNQYDALVSFVFNVGSGAFSRSTLLKLLNAGDYQGAANQFPAWRMSGGVVMAGLVKRRANERALFLA
ncbi:lysozyme [Methylobacillus flagellatus]|uniref:Putative Phage lysozyme n=1 Tax=uncultured marine microorganism HF4000_ANIW137K11 TaxID=455533 RepID=B3T4S1_9ZZZZ|nr:lysozyme [Methylobacillus flagellatus]ABZ07580.1 putative Phage lysozyme [uncultured marine microorganism HF4000_ANIW137K11]